MSQPAGHHGEIGPARDTLSCPPESRACVGFPTRSCGSPVLRRLSWHHGLSLRWDGQCWSFHLGSSPWSPAPRPPTHRAPDPGLSARVAPATARQVDPGLLTFFLHQRLPRGSWSEHSLGPASVSLLLPRDAGSWRSMECGPGGGWVPVSQVTPEGPHGCAPLGCPL